MIENKKNKIWFYTLSILFVIVNSLFIAKESYLISAVPFLVLILLLAFFALDKLLFIIIFLVPLSIPLKEIVPSLDFDMSLPTEPLLLGVLILFMFKLVIEKKFDMKILFHPISIAIYINLFWILITSITSTMPMVSFKFLLTRIWFIVGFYFLLTQAFQKYGNIKRFYWAYIIPMLIVIAITIFRHLEFGLIDQKAAHFVMHPFFNDHTSYGAILAMFIPILLGLAMKGNYSPNKKTIIWMVLSAFIFALVFSYTRAAWVSLVGALAVWTIIKLRVKLRSVLILSTITILIFSFFYTDIMIKLEQNRQDSSTDFKEHIQSISNVSSDASNLERINRWNSAIRMFKEKPFFGWGPGTYMFNYAPFQFSYDKTIISTNAGDMGNAHSEYIGPLSESGVFGTLTFLLIIIMTVNTAIKVYRKSNNKEIKTLALISLLGLVTYYLHGLLNNFLDTDKASAPFWGFMAIIVALDVYHRQEIKEVEKNK